MQTGADDPYNNSHKIMEENLMKNYEEFIIGQGDKKIKVVGPATDPNSWLINREDSLRPEKETFIFDAFRRDFNHIEVTDVDQVYKLCSRSKHLVKWLAIENAKFVLKVKVPTYISDNIDPDEYTIVEKEINTYNKLQTQKAKEVEEIVARFKRDMDRIENSSAYKLLDKAHPVTKIMLINSSDLPISISFAIENYTFEGVGNYPDQKQYAREMLIRYKSALVEAWDLDPTIDIDKLIGENRVK